MGLSLSGFNGCCARGFGNSGASVSSSAWLLSVAHARVEAAVDLRLICFALATWRKMPEQLFGVEEVALAQLVSNGPSCMLLTLLTVVP